MDIQTVPIDLLNFDPANTRQHDKKNLETVKSSLLKWGQVEPLIVQKSTNVVIGGNGRLEVMRSLGWKDCRVNYLDIDNTQAGALSIVLNRSSELASWNMELLGAHLQGLREDGWELEELGFELDDLQDFENLADGGSKEGLTDDDEVPDPPENIHNVQRGQIWQLGDHRLMCGDSTNREDVDRLMAGEKADMVFTDPPYGVDYDGGIQFTDSGVQEGNRKKLANDSDVSIYSRVAPIIREFADGPCYIWFACNNNARDTIDAIDAIGEIHALLIWNKTNAKYGALNANYKQRHEPCIYMKTKGSTLRWDGPTDECTVWDIKRDPRNDLHPTQKPVELAERAIGNHKASTVLDLFLGSGSTLIACEKTNRKCYGMEIDPHYCSVIIERWQNFTGKKAVLL